MTRITTSSRCWSPFFVCFLGASLIATGCGNNEGNPQPSVTQLPVTATSAAPTGPTPTQTLTASPTDSASGVPTPICDLLTQAEATELVGENVGSNQADPAVLGKAVHNSGQIITSCRYKSTNIALAYNVQLMKKPAAEHVAEQKKAVYKVQNPTGSSFAVNLGDAAMGVYSTAGDKPMTRIDVAKGNRLYVVTVTGADQTRQQDLALNAATKIIGKV